MRRLLIVHSCAILASTTVAAAQAPLVTVIPDYGQYSLGTPVSVTVEYCSPTGGGAFDAWPTVWYNGQNAGFSYTPGSSGGCDDYGTATGTVTVDLSVNTLSTGIGNSFGWGSGSATYEVPPPPAQDDYPALEDYVRCALNCFAATYAQSTVPYFSLDAPRNVTLVYNGDRVDPKPFVHVDFTVSGSVPSYLQLRVHRVGGADLTFLNGETALRFQAASGTWRLGGQFSAAQNGITTTDAVLVEIIVGQMFGSSLQETVVATRRLIVVNENSSPIARGWTLAGIQRLYTASGGGALITEGDGSAVYFAWNGTQFVAPAGEFSRLTGTYVRSYPDSTRVLFNASGLMTHVIDRWGNTTEVLYDGSNRVWKIRDPSHATGAPRELVLGYDANGLFRVDDPWGRTTFFWVDGNRNLRTFTDPDNVSTQFTYDGSLRLSTVTNRRNTTVAEFGYHSPSGKLATITGPLIPVYPSGSVRPADTLTAWHLAAVPYAATQSPASPAPAVLSDTARARVADPAGHVTRFTVNSFGQPRVTVDPMGNTSTILYTTAGLVDSVIDPLGVAAGYDYDANGMMTRATEGGLTTNVRYHPTWPSQADSVWGAGPGQFNSIGANGRVAWSRTGGYTTLFTYEGRGRIETATDPGGHLLGRHWYLGTNGNRSKDSLPGGRMRLYGYDAYGRQTTFQASGYPQRTTTYDGINRPLTVNDGVNANPTVFAYDSLWLKSVTDPTTTNIYRFGYNGLGWLTSRTDPANQAETYDYSADGQLRRWRNRRADSTLYTYDALHRRLVRSGNNVAPDTLSYGTLSGVRVVVAANGAARDSMFLNLRLQPDTVKTLLVAAGQTFKRRYRYRSIDGALDSVGATGGGLTFSERLTRYHATTFALDSAMLRNLGGTRTTRFGYNNDALPVVKRLIADSISAGFISIHGLAALRSSVLLDSLQYDLRGRIHRWRTTADARQRRFAHDGLGRLFETVHETGYPSCTWDVDFGYSCADVPADSIINYTYDAANNRLSRTSNVSGTVTARFGPGNRIDSLGTCDYTTDLDGNVTQRACPGETVNFTWSADSRLTGVAIVGGASITLAYDAAGRPMRRDVGGAPASYLLWNGDDVLAELGSSATTKLAEYDYHGLDDLHAMLAGDTPYYAHTDALGNVRGLSSFGAVYRRYGYDEWGNVVTDWDGLGFNGYDRARWKGALYLAPEAGLYFMRNRWYEPRSGRFLSEDPIGLAGGINPYVFGGDDPINRRDPFGTCSVEFFNYGSARDVHVSDGRVIRAEANSWVFIDVPCEDEGGGIGAPVGWRGSRGGWSGTGDGSVGAGSGRAPQRAPPRTLRCLRSTVGTLASFGLDVAGVNLLKAASTLRGGLGLRAFAGGMAARAGQFAGTELGMNVAGYSFQAFGASADQLVVGATLRLVGRVPNAILTPTPFDMPTWWDLTRNLPILGTGMRLGETAHVCLGNL